MRTPGSAGAGGGFIPLLHSTRRIRRGVAAAAALLMAVVAASGLLIWRGEVQQRESLTARFDTRQATAARFVEAYVGGVFRRETELAARSFQGTAGRSFAAAAADQGYDAAVLLDTDGHLLASQPYNPAAVGRDLAVTYAHLRSAVRGAPAVSGVVLSAVRGEPIVAFAVPFQTPQGRRVFSGAYSVENTPLAPFVRNATPFRTAQVFIVDNAGRVVAGSVPGAAGTALADGAPSLAHVVGRSGYAGHGQDRRYFTQGPIQGSTWRMLFAIDTAELFGQIRTTERWAPWLALGGMALLGLLTLGVVYRYLLQRAELQETEARQRAILDAAGEASIGMDQAGRISHWNASASRLLGWSESEAVGRSLVDLIVPPEDRDAHTTAIRRFVSTGATSLPPTSVRVQALTKSGPRADVEFSPSRLASTSGWHYHAFLRDISEQLEHERQLRDLALTDPLTGLLNRRAVLERLDQALARAARQKSVVGVLFIDIDLFKTVNDRYGHATGDELLKAVGTRLRALVRAEDSVARLGGDEFLVVCEDLHSPRASELADRTRAALAQPYEVAGRRLCLTASVGLATAADNASAEVLLARADAQMYDAKASQQAFSDIVAPRKT
ncbi:MAG: hypothetical protein NVS3B18_13710 [Candidatus Dormibacteria bacterium]